MPVGHVLLTTFATFGLLEVGSTIMDPFGKDPEDFAITHLVEWTAVASLDAIAISKRHQQRRGPKVGANTYAFDSVSELRAATTLAALVARWKARRKVKVKEQRIANRQRIELIQQQQRQQQQHQQCNETTTPTVSTAAPTSLAAGQRVVGGAVAETVRLSREEAEQLRLLLRSGGSGSGCGGRCGKLEEPSTAFEALSSAREEALRSEAPDTEHPGRAFGRSGRGAAVAAMLAADAEPHGTVPPSSFEA